MSHIPESELIINPDGSIYHLNLQPEQVADTVITVGDQNRVAKVSKYFDRLEFKVEKREFITHTGWIGKKRLSVVSTGIGPDNIDIVFSEIDALFNIDFNSRQIKDKLTAIEFIRIGTSGCLQKNIPVDSFLISACGIGLDNLMHFYSGNPSAEEHDLKQSFEQFIQPDHLLPVPPYVAMGSKRLLEVLSTGIYQGITLTAPGFYAPQGRELRVKSRLTPAVIKRLTTFKWNDLCWGIRPFPVMP